MILDLSVQHNDSTFVYTVKWTPKEVKLTSVSAHIFCVCESF